MAPFDDSSLADSGVLPGEKDSLDLHVELCARRNRSMERRLKRIEWTLYVGVASVLGVAGIGGAQALPYLQAIAYIAGAISGTPAIAIPGAPG